jgi:hypothetical protein
MERPRSIRTLALVLGIVGASALAGVLFAPLARPLPVAPQLLSTDPNTAALLIFSSSALYAVAALVCASALWRMASWGPASYDCFVASIFLQMGVFLYVVRIPMPIGIGLAFFALLGAGLYWGWYIVRTAYARVPQALSHR